MYKQCYNIYRLKTYYTLSFVYNFDKPNDIIEFAYFIPYTYTRLCEFINSTENNNQKYQPKLLPPLKTLSGLSIPIL